MCRKAMQEYPMQSLILHSDHVSSTVDRGVEGLQRIRRKNIHDNCIQVQNNSGAVKPERRSKRETGSLSPKNSEEKENPCGFGLVWEGFLEEVLCDRGKLIFMGFYSLG